MERRRPGTQDDALAEAQQGPHEQARAVPQLPDNQFQALVESVIDYGIFMLDVTGRVASWNPGAELMTGYSGGEIIGRHFSIFYPPEPIAVGKCDEELRVAERDGRFEEEGWRIRKDGSAFWANVVITAVRRGGDVVGFSKVTRDLSERRAAQEALRLSEERLRLLIDSVDDYAIFVLDPSGHVATWNPGAERLKGYRAQEIIGRHFSAFYPEADLKAGKCEMELEVAQRVGRFEDEGWRVRKDGSRFWANVVISAIRDRDGNLHGFGKVTRDLSQRKQHEEERIELARAEEARHIAEANEERQRVLAAQLAEARDKAEEVTRLKDEFLATVSHELRTPLNAMLGWARMIQQGSLPAEKAAKGIDTIVRNAVAQSQIIDDLLDVSRIIAGKLRLDVDFIDVNAVVSAAIDVVRPAADAKGVRLQVVLNPDAGVIRGDAGRLQQILWNLLTNAVKFTNRGGRVQVILRRADSNVEIEVADDGQGIAPAFLPRIFDRFSQEDAGKTRRVGGLGLGLAIVKHLVELHGGSVGVHSEGQDMGTSFKVRIPLAPVRGASRASLPPAQSTEEVTYPSELTGLKVLILDDEADARELVKTILEKGGVHVTQASSVAEALTAVSTFRPDVIISDIGMPGEDGYVFMRMLRALTRDEGGRTPALALTAYARGEDRRKALVAGFQNHAAKPVEPQELVMVVANLAGRFG